jgi:chemotaxis protein CheY-P-specific phosphatase CheC
MNDRAAQILVRETVDTLEKLAFFFAEPENDPGLTAGADLITVSADYDGPCSGRLIMEFSSDGLAELAANMLGMDDGEEISEEEQCDALKETLNIICGNVLPAIAGSEAVFNITPPQLTHGAFTGDVAAAAAVARLSMDEGVMALYLFSDGDLPA